MSDRYRIAVFDNANLKALKTACCHLDQEQIEFVVMEQSFGKDKQKELALTMQEGKFQGAVIRSNTYFTTALEELDSLSFIGRAGIGVDNINTGLATRKGIPIFFAPGSNSVSVAELVYAQILEFERKSRVQDEQMKQGTQKECDLGKWEKQVKKKSIGRELNGKNMAIIGAGNIGQAVAAIASGLGMIRSFYDPIQEDIRKLHRDHLTARGLTLTDEQSVIIYETLEEAVAQADYITLHVPLVEKTKHLISENLIEKMKDDAVLINDSRYGVVDESAVKTALETGKLRGYVCDVVKDPILMAMPQVLVTAHTGASTKEAQYRANLHIGESIAQYAHSGGKDLLRAYNSPAMDDNLKEYYELVRITAAFVTQYIKNQGEKIESIKTLAVGLPSYNSMVLAKAAAAGTALSYLESSNDLAAMSLLEEHNIQLSSEKIEAAKRGVPSSITLEYRLISGKTQAIEAVIDFKAEKSERYLATALGQFKGNIMLYPVQYILVEHDDVPGLLAHSCYPISEHNFNIEDGQVNLNFRGSVARKLLVFPVRQYQKGPEDVPSELLEQISAKVSRAGHDEARVTYIDLRDYRAMQ